MQQYRYSKDSVLKTNFLLNKPERNSKAMKTKRICIYAKDIQRITGKSEKTGYRILDNIRRQLGKESHQFVTVNEFAEFAGFEPEEVEAFIYD
jgi:hypothetical protein